MTSIISGERQISYPEIHARIARAAAGFRAFGLGGGTPVGMMLRNDFAFFEVSAAAAALGSPVVPINWHLKAEEVAYILADSGAEILVCHADLLPQIRDGLPADIRLLVVTTPPEIAAAFNVPPALTKVPDGMTDWDIWRDTHAASQDAADRQRADVLHLGHHRPAQGRAPQADEAGTGRGLGAGRRHRLWRQAERGSGHPDERPDVPFGAELLRHAGVPQRLHNRARTALRSRGHAATDRTPSRHPQHMVPTMFVRLLRLPDDVKRRYDLSSLRFIVHGAAPCPPQVKRAMIEWWGPVINEYFGSTETGIPVWHSAEEALAKPGTVGRAIEGGIVKIFRPDGELCDVNEPGEIFMRQMSVPDFDYHGKAEARAEAGREGLVSVGDVGYLDEDGYLFLCDRKRDMVISGGVNIYPAEIENALIGMDGVRDCAVFGVPDDEFGERLFACIEPEANAALSPAAVQEFLRGRLANFKVPKDIQFMDAMPREATGKIFKRKLRDLYTEGKLRAMA